jgi:hypothetical protein
MESFNSPFPRRPLFALPQIGRFGSLVLRQAFQMKLPRCEVPPIANCLAWFRVASALIAMSSRSGVRAFRLWISRFWGPDAAQCGAVRQVMCFCCNKGIA